MLHSIPTDRFGALGEPMADAVSRCVHCGFCLAACPTYRELGQEMDSPRGRIVLMKEVLEGEVSLEEAQPHIDRCLGCLACEPACPSGVPYRDLISPFRALVSSQAPRTWQERLRRQLVSMTLPYPERFRPAAILGTWARRLPWVPSAMRPMLDLLPERVPSEVLWPEVTPARGMRRARVALLLGCAQQVLDPDLNTATLEVLAENGVEVVAPQAQGCCGGLAWHTGDLESARTLARRNLLAFPRDVDAVLTNAAGCGSALHEYGLILKGTADEGQARAFAERVQDVSVFLERLGLRNPPTELPYRVVYQDACHLGNAQGVRQPPRNLLRSIPGLELLELPDADQCCGSAGTYNIDQPELAAQLGEKKARAILASGATHVASGNIGCLTQIRSHLKRLGSPIVACHTLQLLRDAYRRPGS